MIEVILQHTGDRLDVEGAITFNFQNSDISDFSAILSNYTFSFEIKKTPNNVKAFEFLGTKNKTSYAPYIAIKVDILFDSVRIQEGANLKILSTKKDVYEVAITGGMINFFDLFGDLKLSHLSLMDLNHDRTLLNIIDSWYGSRPYKYFVADFNGEWLADVNGTTNLNSSYMIPFANVRFIMDKIFDYYNWNYTGLHDLDDQWMSYGNALSEDNASGALIGDFTFDSILDRTYIWLTQNSPTVISDLIIQTADGIDSSYLQNNGTDIELLTNQDLLITLPKVDRYRSTDNLRYSYEMYVNGILFRTFLGDTQNYLIPNIFVNGDKISFKLAWNLGRKTSPGGTKVNIYFNESLKIVGPNVTPINYIEGSFEMKISDFVKDVMIRNGAVALQGDDNKIEFYTINDRLQFPIVDWSEKYIRIEEETYVYDDYAQRNLLTHEYLEDDEDNYADGVILIQNDNIEREKEIYKSFSNPMHKFKSEYTSGGNSRKMHIMPMWEIEEDNKGKKYKPLNNNVYFVKTGVQKTIAVDNVEYAFADFPERFDMIDVRTDYYQDFENLLQNLKIKKIKLRLNALDVRGNLFKARYYFSQENMLYFLNKLTFKNNGEADAEFIELKI